MSVNDFSDNILLTSGEFEKEKNYWLENLKDGVTMAQFPADYHAVRIEPKNRAKIFYHLPDSLCQRLSSLSNRSAYGLYMILLSGVVFLLHKLTSNRDIVAGMPVSKQNTREQYINNVLALRIKINQESAFKEFLLDIKNTVLEAHKNQNFPFRTIAGLLGIAPRGEGFPLLNVLVSMGNIHDESCHREIRANTGFMFEMNQEGLALKVEYSTDLYHGDTIRRLTGYLENFLYVVTQNPGVALSQICILSEQERGRIIHEFNDTFAEYDKNIVIHQLFEEQVKRTPQNTALVSEGRQLSYEVLNQEANQLAGLLRDKGVTRGTMVAVLIDRTAEMIVTVLGILKAGGAYVPLEPGFPDERIKNILKNLGISCIISQYHLLRRIQNMQWELEKLNEIVLMDIETENAPLERVNESEVEALWDHVVGSSVDRVSAGGFKSSYTGEPFSEEEVNEYVNRVVRLAMPYISTEKHVLEIGCGSGLIMFELAPQTASYTGMDPSGAALAYTKKQAAAYNNIKLIKGFAHEIETIANESYDLIILSSTVQFFPGFLYLHMVMTEAVRILKPGGVIIIADNMDPGRKEEFQKSLEEFKRRHHGAEGIRTKTDLDNELYVPRDFYREISRELPRIESVAVLYREKGFENELKYRYDVIIRKSDRADSLDKINDKTIRKKNIWTGWHAKQYETGDLPPVSSPDDMAYIIHTSGSTGTPKGVVVRHKPVINLIEWVNQTFNIAETDRLLFITSLCFDLSVYDIFGILATGGSIRIASTEDIRNPQKLYDIILNEPITFWDSAPAALQQLAPFMIENTEPGLNAKLRLVFLSGDWIPVTLPDALRTAFPKLEVISLGGATEATVWSNYYPIGQVDLSWPSIPYGKPIQNARYYILDSCLQPCPIGVSGDLYIGGDCLASGYINDPFLTDQKFVKDPFTKATDGKMYKTGDLARWFPDGNMEFLGRKDFQVKIRGFRIELGEIESKLLKIALVKEAVVIAKEDAGGNKSLFAYIVADEQLTVAELREYLAKELPDYMIPSYFMQLEKMPVTPNGKLDRKALPEPYGSINTGVEYAAPRDETEKELVKIWQEVLGVEKIGVNDSFYELGGQSIKATVLVSKIHKQFSIGITLRDIFSIQTISELAELIREKRLSLKNEGTENIYGFLNIQPVTEEESGCYPASSAQKRFYLINMVGDVSISYNIPSVTAIEGRLDMERFKNALKTLVKRHESLRTSFELVDGEPVQRVHKDVDLEIGYLESIDGEVKDIIRDLIQPFDLSKAPLLRVWLIRMHPRELLEDNGSEPGVNKRRVNSRRITMRRMEMRYMLLYDMHHIIADGVSMGIMIREFMSLYRGIALPELRIQYKDFSGWQNKFFESEAMKIQEDYWMKILDGSLPVLEMPFDYARPEQMSFEGETIRFTIQGGDTAKLESMAKKYGITLNILLFSVYTILLYKYTGQEDLIIGSLVAGRSHPDLENLIGPFINFLPIRNKINKNDTFAEFLNTAKERILSAYENQDYPFDKMVEMLKTKIAPSRNPLFDTMLIFHNETDPNMQINIDGVSFFQYDLELNVTKLDFKLDIYPGNNGEFDCYLQYNTRLFKKVTIQNFIRHFNILLGYILDTAGSKQGKLSEINLFTEAERQTITVKRKQQDKTPVNLVVAATFTAEPIEDFIKWWGRQFGINISVKFAAYNQVFQELLDNNSGISANDGLNFLLVRFEDWVRNSRTDEKSNISLMERNFSELLEALERKAKKAPYFIGIFPVATHLSLSDSMMNHIESMNKRWKIQLEKIENVYIADFTTLPGLYNIPEVFDPVKDKTGHLPFSDEYYAAMGSMIARKIYAYKNQTFKVVVLDCDNTLWKGVCGEEGPMGVTVDETFTALQKFMLERYQEGMLLALCSKNNESVVWEVFEKNPGMLLKKELFVNWRINWRPKSGNIKELARELNLGLDSIIFIDDSAVECGEVMTNCPDVLTLQLPPNTSQIPAFLKHVWAFDRFQVTVEDRKRSQMYIAEKKRKEIREEGLTLSDFLKGLTIKLSMKEMESPQLARVAQLTQRTNQFNLSTIRRNEEEIMKLVSESGVVCWTVEALDRFGDYGLVGAVITKKIENGIFIDTFLLSCRVLGRHIEDAIISLLKRYCNENGIDMLKTDYFPTEKNKPAEEFLERTGWKAADADEAHARRDYTPYSICTKEIPDFVEFIDCYYKTSYEKTDTEESTLKVIQVLKESAATELETGAGKVESNEWEVRTENEANLRHLNHLIPLKNYNARMLLNLPVNKTDLQLITRPEYLPPTNETEEKLISIWQKVLAVDEIGLNDNFFRLGGHSLKAARLVSIILKTFKVEVPLNEVFRLQTVKEMAKYIDDKQEEYRTGVNEGAPMPDLTGEHEIVTGEVPLLPNRSILEIRKGNIDHWNLCEMVEIYPMPDFDKIKTIVRYILNYHDGLRLRLYRRESGWEQVIAGPQEELPVTVVDLSDIPERLQKNAIEKNADEFQRCIRLADKPVYFVAYDLGPGKPGRLQIIVHHALADGYSFTLLLQDLFTSSIQFMNTGKIHLPPQKTSIKRWAEYLNEYAQTEELRKELDYWLSIPRELNRIPVDYPEGIANNIFKSERMIYRSLLTKEETSRLFGSINGKNIQITEIALAALALCVYEWTKTASLLVDYTMNGRYPLHKDIDLSGTVGWLAFLIPVYFDISRMTDKLEVLESVCRQIRSIPKGGIGYGCLRYLCKDKEISDRMERIPMPEITFNYTNFDFSSDPGNTQELQSGYIKIASESVGEKEGENINRGRLLDLVIGSDENGLFSKWHYSNNVHKAETVEKISELYEDELLSLIKCI